MLLSKKLLLQKFDPLMFLYPYTNINISQVQDFYATRDGVNLFPGSFPSAKKWKPPVYGNRRYLTVAMTTTSDPIVVATSSNGLGWTQSGTIPSGRSLLYAPIVFDGTYFYVATRTLSGAYTAAVQIYRSEDGATWTQVCDISAPSQWFGNYGFFAYGNGTFVLAGEGTGSNKDVMALFSVDGCTTWTTSGLSYVSQYTTTHTNSLCWVNGYFIISIWSDGRLSSSLMGHPRTDTYRSADGNTWTSEISGPSAPGPIISNGNVGFTSYSYQNTGGSITTDGRTYTDVNLGGIATGYTGSSINNKYACRNGYDQTTSEITLYRYSLIDGTNRVTTLSLSSPHSFVNPAIGL